MKNRYNISLGENLHDAGMAHAASLEMDFSELLAHLLRECLADAAKAKLPLAQALGLPEEPPASSKRNRAKKRR